MNSALPRVSSHGPRSLFAAVLALALGPGAGGCALSVEADVPDVELTQHDISIAGVPRAGQAGDVAGHVSFTQTLPDLGLPKGVAWNLDAAKIEFVAKTGISDFSFLQALRVTMTPNGSAAPIELINYEKAGGASVGKVLSVDSLHAVDILEDWKDKAVFDVQFAGALPETAWTVDMSVHFNGKLSYKY